MVVYCMIHISLLVARPLQHSVGNNILYCESLDTYYPGYMLYLDLFSYMVSEIRVEYRDLYNWGQEYTGISD